MVYDLAQVKGAHLPLAARGIVIATAILTEVVIFDGYRQLRENTNEVRRSQVTIPATEGVLRGILTRQKGGNGLGLSIAKSRVEKCRGPSTAYMNLAAPRPSTSSLPFTASSRRQRDRIIPAQPEWR